MASETPLSDLGTNLREAACLGKIISQAERSIHISTTSSSECEGPLLEAITSHHYVFPRASIANSFLKVGDYQEVIKNGVDVESENSEARQQGRQNWRLQQPFPRAGASSQMCVFASSGPKSSHCSGRLTADYSPAKPLARHNFRMASPLQSTLLVLKDMAFGVGGSIGLGPKDLNTQIPPC
ncbi:hypothetical protein P7K49_016256 [Saguinus oedipus]|uniref:Uncharacterized protein n=1 Tax=Saguinus oedipus TaxID=9490 RepID=A0ABQ9VBK2_SAGOE|nr:hypothetical protein P7K49_016256 [Saguinus oedipus]